MLMTIAVPLYYGFLWFWVGPLVAVPWYFYILLVLSFIAEMIFVWVHATSGKRKQIHELNACFVGVMMFFIPLIFIFAGQLTSMTAFAATVFLTLSLVMLVLLFIPKLRNYTLVYETVYCLTFLALISFIAHG